MTEQKSIKSWTTTVRHRLRQATGMTVKQAQGLIYEHDGYLHQVALVLPARSNGHDPRQRKLWDAFKQSGNEHTRNEHAPKQVLGTRGDYDPIRARNAAFAIPPTMFSSAAGMGGMADGFAMAGYKTVGGDEASAIVRQAFAAKFGEFLGMDSANTPLGALYPAWIMEAGSSCRAMARSGHQRGTDDPRSYLYAEAPDKAIQCKVPIVVLEQVPDVKLPMGGTAKFGKHVAHCRTLDEVVRFKFREGGYTVGSWVLNGADYGSTVARKRLYTIAIRGDIMAMMKHDVPDMDWSDDEYIREVDHPNIDDYFRISTHKDGEAPAEPPTTAQPHDFDVTEMWRDESTGIVLPRKQPRDDRERCVQATLEREGLLEDANPSTHHMRVDDITMYDI